MKYLLFAVCSIFFLIGLTGCETPKGFPGVSENIKDSKAKGAFIQEYTVVPNPYKINDTLQITVKEAWLERPWIHGATEKRARLRDSGYQLAINSLETEIRDEDLTWLIGSYHGDYLRMSSRNTLVGDFEKLPGDTIKYVVRKGISLSHDENNKIIGSFILIKKENAQPR